MKKDPELLRCYVEEKSETAFADLVQRHLPSVYGAALRRVGGDAHLAKDVAQHLVTLVSDGTTIVSIAGFRGPSRFQMTAVRVLPGSYEVRGRRAGSQDLVVRLELRGGSPPPPLTIACTVPVGQ